MSAEADLERLVADRLGLRLAPGAAASIVAERGGPDSGAWVAALARDGAALAALAPALTIGESSFFRDAAQMRLVVRFLERRRSAGATSVRMLSAGCSTGEEPYSLAIHALAVLGTSADVSVCAIDLDGDAIARARRGHYTPWSVRNVGQGDLDRWFRRDGSGFTVLPDVRACVRFSAANLVDPGPWASTTYDLVLCRNVLMYLTPQAVDRAADALVRCLAPHGTLLVGPADSLRTRAELELVFEDGTSFYRRRKAVAERPPPRRPPRPTRARAPVAPPAPDVLDLVRQERFEDAVAHCDRSPPAVRAAVYVLAGRPAEAEAIAVEGTGTDADLELVLALCALGRGESERAADHLRAAAFLDPGFAMPHVHLGLDARRRGEHDVARRALAVARELLPRERPDRVILFGGGFGAHTLDEVCAVVGTP